MKKIYIIFGSFEIFGNPRSFLSGLKRGFNNFLIVPFKELKEKRNLKIFGKKIAYGTKSFAISIVFGVFNAIISIVESLARYLDYFTFDQKFRYTRQKLRDTGINGIVDGVVIGFVALKFAFVDTVLSFYTIPRVLFLEKVLWKCILIAPIRIVFSTAFKPPLGFYDFVFYFLKVRAPHQGLINTILPDYSMLRFRMRPPRIFGQDQLIIPYNYDHAVGNDYIRRLGYKVTEDEEYKYFLSGSFRVNGSNKNFALVLTDRQLYVVVVKKYDVKRYVCLKIHKLRSIELQEADAGGFSSIDIHTHVPAINGKNFVRISKIDRRLAHELVQNIEQLMASLRMEIEVKTHSHK